MKPSQKQQVIRQLKENGEVSRNWALSNYISRLGAIIFDLKEEGWDLRGVWLKTEHGRDFIYEVVSTPKRLQVVEYKRPDGSVGFKEVMTPKLL